MLIGGNLTSIFIGYTVIFTRITITWSEIQLSFMLQRRQITTSINNDHGDKHLNMPEFVLKSLFCFPWTIVCCYVMYNCIPFKDSDRWRYCICQKISPQAFMQELQCCRNKHIPFAKNSMACCLSLYAIASCALSSTVNVQPLRACFISLKTWKSHGDMSRLYAGYLSAYHGMAWHSICPELYEAHGEWGVMQ